MPPSGRHHPSQARSVWPPEAGFFRCRMVKGGWEVPCLIRQTDAGWQAVIDGEEQTPHEDPAHAPGVSWVWEFGYRTDEADYLWRLAVKEHAAETDPEHPALHPTRPIDPMRLKPRR